MKQIKRIFAFFLCLTLILPMLPAEALAAAMDDVYTLDNGYIQASVSKKNGGFLINTVEGDLLRKSDNNKKLLYHSDAFDTSFVSLRVNGKDYLFGGKYDGASPVTVTQAAEGGEIAASWTVDGVTFTETISLAEENASEHGMVSVALAAQNNSGAAVPVQARILLDTCLGDQDFAHYQVSGGNLTNTLDTEQIITDEAALRSFYAVDDISDPGITAYVISSPYRAAIGHWNNLAASLFDFAPDASLDFTNAVNDYLTADSACAMYYDLGTVANGASQSVVSYYGVYSNRRVNLENSVAINTVAPLRLNLNEDKTAYVRESAVGSADFAVTVSAENYKSDTSGDLENVFLAVRSTGNLRSLSDSGEPLGGMDYSDTEPLTISYSKIAEGETITKTLYFQAKLPVSASYERITVGMYRDSVTSENLLGEKVIYLLLPGSDGNIPKVSFLSMTPDTVYCSGTRHLYMAITSESIFVNALAQGICSVKAYSADGKTVRDIPAANITVNEGIADVALTEDIETAVGSWYLQLEWTDEAVSKGIVAREFQNQTAACLKFKVSDDPKFRNDCYGVLAAVKYESGSGSSLTYSYRLENFKDEKAFEEFSKAKKYKEILLVFRGNFTADSRYVKKDVDGRTVGALYYTAVSKKTLDPATRETRVDNCVTINNCLDFEGGTMSVYYEDYTHGEAAAEESPILVEFDGDLYTSDARTSVWKGKAAITKLEQGKDFALLHYDANGKRKSTDADPVTLIWPNAFGLAQTLTGMVFKLAYGQFGVMENKDGEIGRTVAFAASLSLKFMSSGDEDDEGTVNYFGRMKELWKDWNPSKTSLYQYAYHGARFEKLTTLNMNDKDNSGSNDKGVQASVMVQDILFGCGQGLVGLNFTVEIGVKNMIDSLPKLTGKLSINTINNWSFGLAGSCKMSNKLNLEAKLSFKSYNNIPVPDEIYFFIGGFDPGINIDGCGVVWITGGGGGISNLYDTIFCKSGVPPLKLIIAASFSIVQVLDGNAKLQLALTGIDLTASDLKIFGEIEAIRKVQLGLQWYPDIKIQAGIYVSMFEQVIEGQGYIILIGKNYTDWFFEMFIQAALKIPASVPAVGGMNLLAVDLGVSTKKIWGAFEALRIGIGVTYYWGESSVHFGSAKDKAQPTYPNLLLSGYDGECTDFPIAYDEENDRTLYAHFGTNFEAPRGAQIISEGDLVLMDEAGVWSDGSKTAHKFNLGDYAADDNEAAAVQLSYRAPSMAKAKELAESFTVTSAKDGGNPFPIEFYNGSNLETANANVSFEEREEGGGVATFCFTVTSDSQFNKNWFINTGSTPADVVLYNVLPLPKLTSVSTGDALSAGGSAAINWSGTGLKELDSVSFFLTSSTDPSEDAGYPLGSVTANIDGGAAALTVPADVPGGSYYLRAVYSKDDQVNGVVHSSSAYSVTNSNTPAAVGALSVEPAGDLKFGVTIPAALNTTGYSVTIYNDDNEKSATDITGLTCEAKPGTTTFEVGGSYTDDEGNVRGLTGGKSYIVGVTPYKTLDTNSDGEDDAIVYGKEVTQSAYLPVSATPTVTLAANGKTLTAVKNMGENGVPSVFTTNELDVSLAFSEAVTGTWTLDNSELWDTLADASLVTGSFDGAAGAEAALTDLTDGDHLLTVSGCAADGDSFAYDYPFTVDTAAPRLLLSAPLNGSVFNDDGTVELTGVTDSDALLTITIDGKAIVSGKSVKDAGGSIDMDGVFSLPLSIPDCNGAAYHTLVISAADRNGNKTAEHELTLTNPGLGEIKDLIIMADDTIPADENLSTSAAGTAKLSVVSVTESGTRFVMPQDRIIWDSFAAEGAASVTADGQLSYEALTKGFVQARYEVTTGAYRTACLTLGSAPNANYVSVSASVGGTVTGGGQYSAGESVTLTAVPDAGYRFDHWVIEGVGVSDLTSPTIRFTMPEGVSVTAHAIFASTSGGGGGSSGGGSAGAQPTTPEAKPSAPITNGTLTRGSHTLEAGENAQTCVPCYRDKDGSLVVLPLAVAEDGVVTYLAPEGQEVFFMNNPVSFGDTANHWAEADVQWAASHGLFNGVGDGRFDPDGKMTRAMFVTVLYRIAGSPEVSGKTGFTDLGSGAWYENAVTWAVANGIVNGVSENSFAPDSDVTREQMCAFVSRFLKALGYEPELGEAKRFADAESISAWAASDVTFCQRAGIIGGYEDGRFAPSDDATRAQNAAVMHRMIEAILKSVK